MIPYHDFSLPTEEDHQGCKERTGPAYLTKDQPINLRIIHPISQGKYFLVSKINDPTFCLANSCVFYDPTARGGPVCSEPFAHSEKVYEQGTTLDQLLTATEALNHKEVVPTPAQPQPRARGQLDDILPAPGPNRVQEYRLHPNYAGEQSVGMAHLNMTTENLISVGKRLKRAFIRVFNPSYK